MNDVRVFARGSTAIAAVLALSVAGSAYGAGAAPDISGTYWATEYHPKLVLVGGGNLPTSRFPVTMNWSRIPSTTVIRLDISKAIRW